MLSSRFLFSLIAVVLTASSAFAQTTLRVYHIGNSVTDTIRYPKLKEMAAAKNKTYTYGRHMIPGAPLEWIYKHPKDGFQEDPYGFYPKALPEFEWDVLTLQPFDRHLDGPDGDVQMAKNYIDLLLKKSPNARIYLYSRWPRKDNDGTLDFGKKWSRTYTGDWDNTEETADYFRRLLTELRKAYPAQAKRILLIPVGDVLLELDKQMKAGKVPGYKSITELYADGIHLNDMGSYVVGCTFYATLFQDSPKGLPGKPYNVANPKVEAVLQETVWKVVQAEPLAK